MFLILIYSKRFVINLETLCYGLAVVWSGLSEAMLYISSYPLTSRILGLRRIRIGLDFMTQFLPLSSE